MSRPDPHPRDCACDLCAFVRRVVEILRDPPAPPSEEERAELERARLFGERSGR